MEDIHPLQYHEPQIDSAGVLPAAENAYTSKRQRRPSVRLGEIGDQPAAVATLLQESLRRPKQWKPSGGKDQNGGKSSKIRQLAKLNAGAFHQEETETLDLLEEENRDSNFDNVAIGSWRTKDSKSKRAPKKPRTNWLPKIDEVGARNAEEDNKSGKGDDDEIDEHSKEQLGLGGSQLKRSHNGSSSRVRVEEERDLHQEEDDEADLEGPLQTTERDVVGSQDGVKNWLQGLGLVRYWPVFEIHEVDEEVLPLLTLEDLKDMGINAVGSRRKMFGAIQKLRKGFS